MHNLRNPASVGQLQDIMRRAKAAGYNGIVLSDFTLSRITTLSPDEKASYERNVAAVQKTAADLGLDFYPCIAPMGYSNGLLYADPNLAEGLPVRDAPFVVHDGQADLDPAEAGNLLKNGDFSQAQGDKLTGWDFQDNIGTASFVDHTISHTLGGQSLRMTDIGKADPQNGHGRIMQTVEVKPFRQYHLSVWIKTQDFQNPSSLQTLALTPDGRNLEYNSLVVQRTQDWSHYDAVFNSLNNSKLAVYFGAWGGQGGSIWWSGARLEEVGLLNVLRRDGCPLTVAGDDGTVYAEGRDFAPVKDDRMGNVPWPGSYEVFHAPPSLHLTPTSRIREGQMVRVSFYHPVVVNDGQVACCMSDPKVYAILKDQVRRIEALFHPKGYFLSHDEIRVANWDESCRMRHLTPGQILADNVARCIAMVRDINPRARVFVWSDMFDPNHNAHDNYYLVNGTWAGSWEGLPPGVIIVNWNSGGGAKTLSWFAGRGNAQILAGYYDGPPDSIRAWLDLAKTTPGIEGAMYTTWAGNYNDLETFARAAWGTEAVHAPAGP
jgi:hypothetical protein